MQRGSRPVYFNELWTVLHHRFDKNVVLDDMG